MSLSSMDEVVDDRERTNASDDYHEIMVSKETVYSITNSVRL